MPRANEQDVTFLNADLLCQFGGLEVRPEDVLAGLEPRHPAYARHVE